MLTSPDSDDIAARYLEPSDEGACAGHNGVCSVCPEHQFHSIAVALAGFADGEIAVPGGQDVQAVRATRQVVRRGERSR